MKTFSKFPKQARHQQPLLPAVSFLLLWAGEPATQASVLSTAVGFHLIYFFYVETGSHYNEADLKHKILLPLPPEYWDYT
jgi:hypothetical protein